MSSQIIRNSIFWGLLATLFVMQSSQRTNCKYCKRDITRTLVIQCAECNEFHLCSDCFCAGVEIEDHRNNHKYRVSDCLEVAIFAKDWTVNEELTILEGIFLNNFFATNY